MTRIMLHILKRLFLETFDIFLDRNNAALSSRTLGGEGDEVVFDRGGDLGHAVSGFHALR